MKSLRELPCDLLKKHSLELDQHLTPANFLYIKAILFYAYPFEWIPRVTLIS